MEENPTVWSERLQDVPAIKMVWMGEVEVADLRDAFNDISAYLDDTEEPLPVIVDITRNPRFPIVETVLHALAGPFRHAMLSEWLVIGNSPAARKIEDLLARVTSRSNVRWFDTEEEAVAYIREQGSSRAAIA